MAVAIANQWSNTFTQPAAFQTTPPALESVAFTLTAGNSVGGGSGTPTAGNWLFCLVGMSEQATTSGFTVAVHDDVRSFWHPGKESTSTWAVSTGTALTRTAVWYTANPALAAGTIYVAPTGAFSALTVLVIEVSGLGPWDTVAGIFTNYAAAATSLSLSLGAPSAQALIIGAVAGDSTTATQAFAPVGWTGLHTVTATNGTDHTTDSALTSAYIVTSGSVSVTGTAVSATDLSGVLLSVLTTGTSPIAAGANPAWPGVMKCEAAFGGGFQTPPDKLQWTDITARTWEWTETSGIQFQLGQIQATDANLEFDNWDGALTPVASPWSFAVTGTPGNGTFFTVTTAQSASISLQQAFTDTLNPGVLFTVTGIGAPSGGLVNVTFTPTASTVMASPDTVSQAGLAAGTPLRVRAALGTMAGTTYNRWYLIQRNMQEWPQVIDETYRRYLPVTGTDIWAALSASGPSAYRGEVYQDSPYAWWACDDQPLAGGVQPTTLRNSALGNTNTLTIQAASGGVSAGDSYSTTGVDLTTVGVNIVSPVPPGIAVYAVGQQPGFLYGDPASSQASFSTGNPVTASPGSAAWQQTGLLGNTGANGWFLTCNDASFPGLSGGVSAGLWFNATFLGTTVGFTDRASNTYDVAGQPIGQITLLELATATAPVLILYLDSSGHLILETFNGATGTNHSVYSSSDLRSASWHHVMVTTDGSSWTVYLNGGITATATGSGAGMTSAWTWLIGGADLGASGGSTLSAAVHGGDFALSHIQVFSHILPKWRILAHYCAATTAFGLVPAPQTLSLSEVINKLAGVSYVPDGTEFQGSYGNNAGAITSYAMSAVAVAQIGSFTSGPSARATISGIGQNPGTGTFGNAVWVSWTAVAPAVGVYTASSANAELNAATCCGSGDSFTSGFGSGASGHGVCQTAAGTNASPPTSASALGDTVAQRLERILAYAGCTYPGRCIDAASLAVQAATDIGGQQAGVNLQNVAQSDGGLLFIDTQGNLTYWSKTHLAAQFSSPVWTLGPAASGASVIPYAREITWLADPQKVFNAIQVTPFSPDGASLAVITPSSASTVNTSQAQYGTQPRQVTSYLQSTSEMQTFANFLLTNYGQVQVRVENLKVDAATYAGAWAMVLQASVGDVISVQNWAIGGGAATGTFRISNIRRRLKFGGRDEEVTGSVELYADFEPVSYWS